MFSLVKKDFITSIKLKGILYLILISFIVTFIIPGVSVLATTLLPVAIGYLAIMNTFYYDNFNNSNEFILSIPTKREDIVYSRYIFSLIMILIGVIITEVFLGGVIYDSMNVLTFKDVSFAMVVLLLSLSIIIPLIYKFGYGKMRIISPIILFGIYYLTFSIFSPIDTKIQLVEKYGNFPITLSAASMATDTSAILEFIVNNMNLDFVNYLTLPIFTGLLFIISMFISVKIFTKKSVC